ncbi:hypothetical protein FRC06_003887, partial [Ceratobasidium sp. 370]
MRFLPTLLAISWALNVGGTEQEILVGSERDRELDGSAVKRDSFLIFNEVNSLLRQWGNALAPNGFSVTLASVPANTLLYHARTDANEPTSPEWFAFDAEMSYGIYGGRKNTSVYLRTYRTTSTLEPLLYFNGLSAALMGSTLDTQDLLAPPPPSNSTPAPDPFGDYARAKRLCIWAGERGIKGFVRTNAGFELIWCNMQDERVKLVRNVDVTRWADEMDDHSDRSGSDEDGEKRRGPWGPGRPVPAAPSSPLPTHRPGPGGPGRRPPGRGGFTMFARYASWEWLRAASHAYNGLGEARVKLQSGWHVTSRGIAPTSDGITRVVQLPADSIAGWKAEVDQMLQMAIVEKRGNSGVDWRALTDQVVDKYGDRLPELSRLLKLASANTLTHTPGPNTNTSVHLRHAFRLVSSTILPFYDHYASRDEQVEICTFSVLPDLAAKDGEADSLNQFERKIWTAITHVHRSICAAVLDVYAELAALPSLPRTTQLSSLETISARVDGLIAHLAWSGW